MKRKKEHAHHTGKQTHTREYTGWEEMVVSALSSVGLSREGYNYYTASDSPASATANVSLLKNDYLTFNLFLSLECVCVCGVCESGVWVGVI